MEVTDIANVATTLAQVGTSDAVNIAVLKRANDIEAQNAAALISAIPTPTPVATTPSVSNLPPNLGRNVNTTA